MMDKLQMAGNELVPVYVTETGEKVVNGRELHSVLKSKQDFSTWVKKKLLDCDAVENEDYDLLHNFVEQTSGAKHRIDYLIKLDTAKEMAILENELSTFFIPHHNTEEMQEQIKKLQEENKQAQAKYNSDMEQLRVTNAIKVAIAVYQGLMSR